MAASTMKEKLVVPMENRPGGNPTHVSSKVLSQFQAHSKFDCRRNYTYFLYLSSVSKLILISQLVFIDDHLQLFTIRGFEQKKFDGQYSQQWQMSVFV